MIDKDNYSLNNEKKYNFDDLIAVMAILRSDKGCPWDREQTHQSIRNNFIEETYEAAEAIDSNASDLLKEELGDVLLQVVFHAQIEKDGGGFDISDVTDGIVRKLIFRHPHIFGNDKVGTASEMLNKWEEVKRIEKKYKSVYDTLTAVPVSLPALMRAEKIYSRMEKGGYGYCSKEIVLDKCRSLIKSLSDDYELQTDFDEKLGELLFSLCAYAKKNGRDAEETLYKYCKKVVSDFEKTEVDMPYK